ncbi:hypothetical protein Ahy_B03g064467 [Arachis hypogaea]|uniref:ATP-dependent DNA helicase n=1 Tax=Arachis hypogaea TaxID=3818 RepID=A0A444ZZN4_ARAHY|nr:hypothetical protein Ahy_B03g064467 [Arachis hypogaea]
MLSRYCYEAPDRCLRNIIRHILIANGKRPFGKRRLYLVETLNKYRLILTRYSDATINSSYLWKFVKVLQLSRNMRLTMKIKEFRYWLLKVGDDLLEDRLDGESEIKIPMDMIVLDSKQAFDELIDLVFPSLVHRLTLDVVDKINSHLLSIVPSDEKVYLSSDNLCIKEVWAQIVVSSSWIIVSYHKDGWFYREKNEMNLEKALTLGLEGGQLLGLRTEKSGLQQDPSS